MRAIVPSVESPWFWTLVYGYEATREAAMAAFAKKLADDVSDGRCRQRRMRGADIDCSRLTVRAVVPATLAARRLSARSLLRTLRLALPHRFPPACPAPRGGRQDAIPDPSAH